MADIEICWCNMDNFNELEGRQAIFKTFVWRFFYQYETDPRFKQYNDVFN